MAIDVRTVLDAFEPSLFVPHLQSKDRLGVLREMVERVQAAGVIRDGALLLEMLQQRESLGSTGIGHGVAVPHGRSLAVPRLIAAFGYHPRGVDWNSVDEAPVHLVFLVLAPPLEQTSRYLPFLGRIVEFVNDPGRRADLQTIKDYDDFQEKMRVALG